MSDRKDSFRHLVDAIKRTPVKAQQYVNDYCEHEHVNAILFTQKDGHFSILWKSTQFELAMSKKIATVISDIQLVVAANNQELKAIGLAKLELSMYNASHPENVITLSEDNNDYEPEEDDEEDEFDDDDEESMCADCDEENYEGRQELKHTENIGVTADQLDAINQAIDKLAKKFKKLNRKVDSL